MHQRHPEEPGEELLQNESFSNQNSQFIQKQMDDDNSIIHPPDSGLPLSTVIKKKVEPVIGADLSQVKVHTSEAAADSAEAIGAKAFNPINWPRDSSGHSWKVHHIQPLKWNGPDAPSNWVAVPYNIHSDLHRWWNQLKRLVQTDIEVIEALETGEQAESVRELTETTS